MTSSLCSSFPGILAWSNVFSVYIPGQQGQSLRLFIKENYSDSAKSLAGKGLIYVIYSRLLYTSNLVSARVGAFDTTM